VDVAVLHLVEEEDVVAEHDAVTLLPVLVAGQNVKLNAGRRGVHAHLKFEAVLPLLSLLF
jgi:hypothetical protein